jgi:AhpD family alkylhydroperoxidase
MHSERLLAHVAAPAAMKLVREVDQHIAKSGLEKNLVELVKMRASQINGCAFCLDMHSKDARRAGETEQRLYLLNAWRESSLYSPRERAALAWTDALTRIEQTHAPDDVYGQVRENFDDQQIAELTILIGLINLYNRLAIGLRYEHPRAEAS